MGSREQVGYFRPLCPKHRVVMVSGLSGEHSAPENPESVASRSRECPVNGCPEKYSPGFGYFTVVTNDDHWVVTNSASVRIARRGTQVICGEHKEAMFIESFADVNPELAKYCCPQKGCGQRMEIVMGGPATYWLGPGFFRAS